MSLVTAPTPSAQDLRTRPHRELAVYCKNVKKTYDTGGTKVHALRGVDLSISVGELMMLVGPSGCGKTTLISVVAGILDRDEDGPEGSGECVVFGQDFSQMTAGQKTRFRGQTVGFVFQQFNLLPALTAAQNVAVPLFINGISHSVAIKKANDLLDRVGLGDRTGSYPRNLSGGQQQRVAIARALVHDPKLIVCDEPTSALDHATGHIVMGLLKDVAMGEGRTLVIVTHDSRIFSFADRIAQMDDGRIIKTLEGREAIAAEALH